MLVRYGDGGAMAQADPNSDQKLVCLKSQYHSTYYIQCLLDLTTYKLNLKIDL